ncbi:MAG: radical SAM protein [Candidatus Thorarchaeota archaeon]
MFPCDIRIQITSECNQYCSHCFASSNDGTMTEELSDTEFLNIIDQITRQELDAICITGGEPLVRSGLVFKILERLQNHSAIKTINTNGWFLTRQLAMRLEEAGLDTVQISLDSSIKEKHDSFRGLSGSHDRALEAIKHSVKAGLETHVRVTITPFNFDEMPAILDLALSKGAHRLVVKPLVPSGRASLSCEPVSPEQHKKAVMDLISLTGRNREETRDYVQFLAPCLPFLVDREYVKYSESCECGDGLAFITSSGDVQPCGYAHLVLGNLLETSLEHIWSSSAIIRRWRNGRLNGKCLTCEFGEICRGGCRAIAYETTGNLTSPDPTCWQEDLG